MTLLATFTKAHLDTGPSLGGVGSLDFKGAANVSLVSGPGPATVQSFHYIVTRDASGATTSSGWVADGPPVVLQVGGAGLGITGTGGGPILPPGSANYGRAPALDYAGRPIRYASPAVAAAVASGAIAPGFGLAVAPPALPPPPVPIADASATSAYVALVGGNVAAGSFFFEVDSP